MNSALPSAFKDAARSDVVGVSIAEKERDMNGMRATVALSIIYPTAQMPLDGNGVGDTHRPLLWYRLLTQLAGVQYYKSCLVYLAQSINQSVQRREDAGAGPME